MKIKIKKLHQDAVIPKYASEGASGFDLVALEETSIMPGETKLVKTGIAVAIDPGYELQVRPRSGLSLKTHLRVANAPGTVDSDYRGEVSVIMTNTEDRLSANWLQSEPTSFLKYEPYIIKKGDRIAQGVIVPVIRVEFEEVDYLNDTVRGSGGFGSSGK